jgi:hypothetical protein
MNKGKGVLKIALAAVMLLFITGFVFAAEVAATEADGGTKAERHKGRMKLSDTMEEVKGTVSGIGANYIAVSYAADAATGAEYEMLLQFDKKEIKLEHRTNLKDIEVGDTVRVQYQKVVEKDEQGREVQSMKAKTIFFIKPAQNVEELRSGEPLPLKGVK